MDRNSVSNSCIFIKPENIEETESYCGLFHVKEEEIHVPDHDVKNSKVIIKEEKTDETESDCINESYSVFVKEEKTDEAETSRSLGRDKWMKVRDNHHKAFKHPKTVDNWQSNFTPSKSATDTGDNDNEEEISDADESLSSATIEISSLLPTLFNRPNSSRSISSSGLRNTQPVYRKRNQSGIPSEKTAATVLHEYLYKKGHHDHAQVPGDSLTSFFMTMAKTVQGFPVRDQIELKQKIFNLITQKEIDIVSRDLSGD